MLYVNYISVKLGGCVALSWSERESSNYKVAPIVILAVLQTWVVTASVGVFNFPSNWLYLG